MKIFQIQDKSPYFRVVEHGHFYYATVVSLFLDYHNQKLRPLGIPCSHCQGPRIPGWRTKIPQATWHGRLKEKKIAFYLDYQEAIG